MELAEGSFHHHLDGADDFQSRLLRLFEAEGTGEIIETVEAEPTPDKTSTRGRAALGPVLLCVPPRHGGPARADGPVARAGRDGSRAGTADGIAGDGRLFGLWGLAWLVTLLALRRPRREFGHPSQWVMWFVCAGLLTLGAGALYSASTPVNSRGIRVESRVCGGLTSV